MYPVLATFPNWKKRSYEEANHFIMTNSPGNTLLRTNSLLGEVSVPVT